jgi:hypothetical protein
MRKREMGGECCMHSVEGRFKEPLVGKLEVKKSI